MVEESSFGEGLLRQVFLLALGMPGHTHTHTHTHTQRERDKPGYSYKMYNQIPPRHLS